jgi:hypothetical protein
VITDEQKVQYERDGYLILRQPFTDEEMARLDEAFKNNPPLDGNTKNTTYPAPNRYTMAKSSWTDPGFIHFAEQPSIVDGAKRLLDDDVYLTAYVLYDRTPGGPGLPAHNDYKRWRPVGSSMNWLFTIIPMCDFTEETGILYVAPGSHRLDRVTDRGEGVLHVDAAIKPDESDFIDPQLKRGDLLFMNMHLWHKADDNNSDMSRAGLFNKYGAKRYPPATGYYVYSDAIYNAMSDAGKELIAVHSDKPVATTRLLLQRENQGGNEFFFLRDGDIFELPGGPAEPEQAIPDWDIGNYIDSLADNINRQIRIETPWVSYVGDYDEGDHLCRIYGYPMNWNGFPVAYKEGQWISEQELSDIDLKYGYELQVIKDWLDPAMIRGKGLSQAKSRIDQYAF